MIRKIQKAAATAALGLGLLASTGAPLHAQSAQPVKAKHHSVLKGALVGAAAGHMLGHHGKVGAAAGALWQHRKNKKG